MVTAAEIPVARTPVGGYGTVMPSPVLDGCTDPLVEGAPDLRGMWRTATIAFNGVEDPDHLHTHVVVANLAHARGDDRPVCGTGGSRHACASLGRRASLARRSSRR